MKVTRILVPLDGSTLAEAAVPEAVEIAHAHSAMIVLLRVADMQLLSMTDPVLLQGEAVRGEMSGREAEQYLAEVAGRLVPAGISVETAVWRGQAAAAVVEAADLLRADLIVMTSHGRSGLGRVMLGSVAEGVLRGARVPILLLRPSEIRGGHRGEPVRRD